jgi:signal transduction histidine kinase
MSSKILRIAHDFNNLLVGILGGISYALEALPRPHETRPMLQNALLASERAAMLTRQMLAYAGKGKFVIEDVNVPELVRSTRRLNIQTSRDTPMIEADASQIQQILMNLIINAAEAIGEETAGIVMVRTGIEALSISDALEGLDPGTYAFLEVVDTGAG